jgi:PAS domain S-box-containing protein
MGVPEYSSDGPFKYLIENMHDGFCVIERNGRFTYVNSVLCDKFGLPREWYAGKGYLQAISPGQRRMARGKFESVLAGEVVAPFGIVFTATEGSERWVEVCPAPVICGGLVTGVLAVCRDVTDTKKQAEEDKLCRDNLEALVEERTRELLSVNARLQKEIDERKEMQKALEEESQNLEETNAAVRVLLKDREKDKSELEKKVRHNINKLVLPYIAKLKASRSEDAALLDILESNLNEVLTVPFMKGIASQPGNFTPKEIQIADLIRKGKTTKEISGMLNISMKTIDLHRYNLRKKLKISRKKTNLQTYLLSLS